VNIMTERNWEILGKPTMTPSLGGIGLFRGKLINLSGKLTQISMHANGNSTEEDIKIVKFIENNTPLTMLLGKPWIEKDQARRKEEEEVLEQKKQELKYFMTIRITHLIE
jgi:hypothetical protein